MLFSCICVCHNKPAITHEAIESVINQSYHNWELIVMDSGVLYDQGYYDRFKSDKRINIVRSKETDEIRQTKAMAPWCFNEAFRNGLVNGDIIMYLSDDDILYPCAFETFVAYCNHNPKAEAMYASQDIGVIYPNGWRAIIGERRANARGGKCCNGRAMDCQVDYLQFCHKRSALNHLPSGEYWSENKGTESHADGVFMEAVGSKIPIYPIDVKVSQNRRTPESIYNPSR